MGRKTTLFIVVSAIMALMLVALVACAAPSPEEKPPVKIALITPTTGASVSVGDDMTRGFKLAIKQFNEKGGILGGREVEGLIYDEVMTVEGAVASAKKAIVVDKVKGITGLYASHTGLAVMEVAREYQVPYLPVCESPKLITEGYYGLVKPSIAMEDSDRNVPAWAEAMGVKTAVLVFPDLEFAHDTEQIYRKAWDQPESPVKLLDVIYHPYGKPDLSIEIAKAVGLEPDFLYTEQVADSTILQAMKLAHELGYEGIQKMCWGVITPIHIATAGEYAEGVWMNHHYLPDPDVPANREYMELCQKEYGKYAVTFEEYVYEGTNILLLGMDKAGTDTDLEKITEGMHTAEWMTPRGEPLEVLPNGQVVVSRAAFAQVRGGKIVLVEYFPIPREVLERPRKSGK